MNTIINEKYKNIIDLPRPVFDPYEKMHLLDYASQFCSFSPYSNLNPTTNSNPSSNESNYTSKNKSQENTIMSADKGPDL